MILPAEFYGRKVESAADLLLISPGGNNEPDFPVGAELLDGREGIRNQRGVDVRKVFYKLDGGGA